MKVTLKLSAHEINIAISKWDRYVDALFADFTKTVGKELVTQDKWNWGVHRGYAIHETPIKDAITKDMVVQNYRNSIFNGQAEIFTKYDIKPFGYMFFYPKYKGVDASLATELYYALTNDYYRAFKSVARSLPDQYNTYSFELSVQQLGFLKEASSKP